MIFKDSIPMHGFYRQSIAPDVISERGVSVCAREDVYVIEWIINSKGHDDSVGERVKEAIISSNEATIITFSSGDYQR